MEPKDLYRAQEYRDAPVVEKTIRSEFKKPPKPLPIAATMVLQQTVEHKEIVNESFDVSMDSN